VVLGQPVPHSALPQRPRAALFPDAIGVIGAPEAGEGLVDFPGHIWHNSAALELGHGPFGKVDAPAAGIGRSWNGDSYSSRSGRTSRNRAHRTRSLRVQSAVECCAISIQELHLVMEYFDSRGVRRTT